MILATFAPPGAPDTEYVPYFGFDDQGWTRADFVAYAERRQRGEFPTRAAAPTPARRDDPSPRASAPAVHPDIALLREAGLLALTLGAK